MKKEITGYSLHESDFIIKESIQTVDVSIVHDVLQGSIAGYWIHDYTSEKDATRIFDNFWASSEKVPRMGYGEEGVEGYFIGASHIEKTTEEYLEEAKSFEPSVMKLYEGTNDPVSTFRGVLASQYNNGITVRPARHDDLTAGHSKAVAWNNFGNFLLEPHDDLAQLSDPKQKGFEIQNSSRVMAVNFYPKTLSGSGQLKIWNIEPDVQSRINLNLTYSGFPYPPELLEKYSHHIISVETGDLLIINGNLIHGVLRGNATSLQDRLLIAFFMSSTNNNELIWWT